MARPTISDLRNLGDVLTTSQWDVSLIQVPKSGSYPNSDDINFRCLSSDAPKATSEGSIEVKIREVKIKQPGTLNYAGQLTLTFVETADMLVMDFLKEWRNVCFDPKTGTRGKKEEVEAIFGINILDSEGKTAWTYKIYGCFLEDYELGQLSENAEAFNPSLTISYDYFEDGKNI